MGRRPYPGIYKLSAVPAVADPLAPTEIEITAGVDLIGLEDSEGLAAIDGLTVDASVQDTPDYVSLLTGSVPGRSSVGVSQLTFYRDDIVTTIFDHMQEGLAEFLVVGPFGFTVGQPSTVWSYSVIAKYEATPQDEAQQYIVGISTGTPVFGTVT